jgi:hypothetical protein
MSDVYVRAAEVLASGDAQTEFSCCTLDDVGATVAQVCEYTALFHPSEDAELRGFDDFWGIPWLRGHGPEEERAQWRLTALCLMSAMVEG